MKTSEFDVEQRLRVAFCLEVFVENFGRADGNLTVQP